MTTELEIAKNRIKELENELADLQIQFDEIEQELRISNFNDPGDPAITVDTGSDVVSFYFEKGNLSDINKCEAFASSISLSGVIDPTIPGL